MSVKETVKNVMQAVVTMTSVLLFAGKSKNNEVQEIYLSTSKSMPLPLLASDVDPEEEAAE